MPLEATIRSTIESYVKQQEPFTSVDIANAIKKTGIWIRNSEVAAWLRKNYDTDPMFDEYQKSPILVCNDTTTASLYHSIYYDQNEYTDREQRPLTPQDVKQIKKDLKDKTRPDTTPDIADVLDPNSGNDEDDEDDDTLSITIASVDRLKIPGMLIRKLGWNPGDPIDPALIKTHRSIPSHLRVNSDYRVSIPRNTVDWGTKPVKVIYKKGAIIFEKA